MCLVPAPGEFWALRNDFSKGVTTRNLFVAVFAKNESLYRRISTKYCKYKSSKLFWRILEDNKQNKHENGDNKTVGEFSLICCTSMAHEGNTKIWAKIICTRAPNFATKPTTLEKSSYSAQSQKLIVREQLLETPVPCDMANHAARENNLAAGTRV